MTQASDVFGVIMAGGSGTRFWPASRNARPKQLLPFGSSNKTLLRATAERLFGLTRPNQTIVVTADRLAEAVQAEVPELLTSHILREPAARNTAPCVAWAASVVYRQNPEAVMAVLPADQYIADEPAFERTLRTAIEIARGGQIVTIGIVPTRAETGYGYIERGADLPSHGELPIAKAARFTEKPDQDTAEQFLASGKFLWNSGMFFFRADTIRNAFSSKAPQIHHWIEQFEGSENEADCIVENFTKMPALSVDVAVMEKVDNMVVVSGDFGWSDVGSWTSAWELSASEPSSNVGTNAIFMDSQGCYVKSEVPHKIVALVGVKDLVVVDTQDALLVMPRNQAQRAKDIVEEIKKRGQSEYL